MKTNFSSRLALEKRFSSLLGSYAWETRALSFCAGLHEFYLHSSPSKGYVILFTCTLYKGQVCTCTLYKGQVCTCNLKYQQSPLFHHGRRKQNWTIS